MEFNKNKTYYKVTNENENHNGLQYHDGLVEDIHPFDDDINKSCTKGRIYITDLEHIHLFFDYGCWIREITLPNDVQYVCEEDKIGVNKVIMGRRYSFEEYFDKWFDKEKFDWDYSGSLAIYCSEHFDKWFDGEKFDWDYSHYLAVYCLEHFDKWFDSEKFNWVYSYSLAEYCSEHFDKWFDKEKFNWNSSHSLAKYCSDKKHIWEKYIYCSNSNKRK